MTDTSSPAPRHDLPQRIPEPELMDDKAQAVAYAEADFEQPHREIMDHFQACFPDHPQVRRAADLGCGPADISVRLARLCPDARIDAIDGAPAMLDQAARRLRREGLHEVIELRLCRLPDDRLAAAYYDTIVSNSLLHHLHAPGVLWETICRIARPGARIFIADLMRPASRAAAKALVREHAAAEPEVLQRDFHHSLLAAFRPEEVRSQLQHARIRGLRVEAISDRHMLIQGRLVGS